MTINEITTDNSENKITINTDIVPDNSNNKIGSVDNSWIEGYIDNIVTDKIKTSNNNSDISVESNLILLVIKI